MFSCESVIESKIVPNPVAFKALGIFPLVLPAHDIFSRHKVYACVCVGTYLLESKSKKWKKSPPGCNMKKMILGLEITL